MAFMKIFPEITEKVLTPRIIDLLTHRLTRKLVNRYFNPQGHETFSGNYFHTLGINHPEKFSTDDLLSLNLLDESVSTPQIRELTSGQYDELLKQIDSKVDITQLDGDVYEHADRLYKALSEIYGFGPTRVSKLLARKRPDLLPIRDSIVNAKLQISGFSWWKSLASTMRQPSVRELLDELTPASDEDAASLLRVLDVAIWMHGSRSEGVLKVWRELEIAEI